MSKHPQYNNPPTPQETAQEAAVFTYDNKDAEAKKAKGLNAELWDIYHRYKTGKISPIPRILPEPKKSEEEIFIQEMINDAFLLQKNKMTAAEYFEKYPSSKVNQCMKLRNGWGGK